MPISFFFVSELTEFVVVIGPSSYIVQKLNPGDVNNKPGEGWAGERRERETLGSARGALRGERRRQARVWGVPAVAVPAARRPRATPQWRSRKLKSSSRKQRRNSRYLGRVSPEAKGVHGGRASERAGLRIPATARRRGARGAPRGVVFGGFWRPIWAAPAEQNVQAMHVPWRSGMLRTAAAGAARGHAWWQ